jgi:hypothetical protein
MMCRVSGAFVASVSAVALLLAANTAFARGGAAAHAGFAPSHSHPAFSHQAFRPRNAHALRHHRGNGIGGFWGGWGDYSYAPTGEPVPDVSEPAGPDLRATCTYDIPWDWVHRCPPAVAPSARAYAPACSNEPVTVPGRDGKESIINVTRCY